MPCCRTVRMYGLGTYNVSVVGKPRSGSTVMTSTTVCPALQVNHKRSDDNAVMVGRAVWKRPHWAKRSRIDCGDRLGVDGDGGQRQHNDHICEESHREG